MKPLAPVLHIGSGTSRFEYRAILRKGMHAVYAQWQYGCIVAYEAFRIMSHNGYELAGTWIEPAESMPSASAWGIHGFTLPTKEAAIRKMALMVAKGAV